MMDRFIRNTHCDLLVKRAQRFLLTMVVMDALACGFCGCGGSGQSASPTTGTTGTSSSANITTGSGGSTTTVNSNVPGTYTITFSGTGPTTPSKGSFNVTLALAGLAYGTEPFYNSATIDSFKLNTPSTTLTPDVSGGGTPFDYDPNAPGVASAFTFKQGGGMTLNTTRTLSGNPPSLTGVYTLGFGTHSYQGDFTMTKTAN